MRSLLLNPKKYDRVHPDEKTHQVMVKTIEFFEKKGLKSIKEDGQASRWFDDFLRFLKEEQIFATLQMRLRFPLPKWQNSKQANC